MDDFIEFAKSIGLIIENTVVNNSIQRVPVEDGKKGNKDGAYCLYQNISGIAGWVQNFRTGEYATYGSKQKLNEKEIIQRKEKLQNELLSNYNKAAQTAAYLINMIFEKAAVHPYLTKKQIKPNGAYVDKYNALIIPLRNISGTIRSFQRITGDGFKSFLKGGEQSGNFFQFGTIETKVIICEGFATGASIFEATGIATISAMNASNLVEVAIKIRQRYGEKLEIIIAADNDALTAGNPGVTYAKKAASACGGNVVIPFFHQTEQKVSDFNDLFNIQGANEVKRQILSKDNCNIGDKTFID